MENKLEMMKNMEQEHNLVASEAANNPAMYETKFVLEADSDYDLYEKKIARTQKAMPALYAKEAKREGEDFSSFVSKAAYDGSFSSVFSVKNTEDFFGGVKDYYNPFRKVSTTIKTNADSIEVPALGEIVAGWNNAAVAGVRDVAQAAITVGCKPIFAKMELPLHFLQKVEGHQTFLRSLLGAKLSQLERAAFLTGDGNTQPMGIFRNGRLSKIAAQYPANRVMRLADILLDATFSLKTEYKHDACFMISSNMQAKLAKEKDAQGRYIFENKQLFGYDVYTLDELDNVDAAIAGRGVLPADADKSKILFGNFKYGHVIADREQSEVTIHKMFDKPNSIGLSMTNTTGAALVLPEAVVAIETDQIAAAV